MLCLTMNADNNRHDIYFHTLYFPIPFAEVCSQPREIGPCFEQHLRYYYDENMDECRPFVYSGCDGNDNNFESQEECYATCSVYPDEHVIRKPGER